MKIALFTSNRTTIPPEKNVVAASAALTAVMADKLVEAGHDVTLYAAKGSVSKAKIIDLDLPPSQVDFAVPDNNVGKQVALQDKKLVAEYLKNLNQGMKLLYVGEVFKDSEQYDIIHLQTEPMYLGMAFTKLTKTPVVFTNHNMLIPQEAMLLDQYKHLPIIAISEYQKRLIPGLNYLGPVYNGIDVSTFPFSETSDDYIYLSGRLVAVKGVKEGIEIAQSTDKEFKIGGTGTEEFVSSTITPFVNEKIQYLGHIDKDTERWYELYRNAKTVILPIQWEEPFGLVMIEAMACGTPVVAFARGAVPEIVKDGVTGFVVNPSDEDIRGDFIVKKTGIEGFKEAVERMYALSSDEYMKMRRNCRKHVEEKFSVERMIDGYIKIYKQVIENY